MDRLQQAIAFQKEGKLSEAIALYRAILADQPRQPDVLHLMGTLAQQLGNSELALKLIEASLAINNSFAPAWLNRALILRLLNRKQEALESALQALELDPNLADAWDFSGNLLRQLKRYSESQKHHTQALALCPDHPSFRSNYAALLLAIGDVEGAYKLVANQDVPGVPPVQEGAIVLGNIWQAAGYPEKAIAYYSELYKHRPYLSGVRINEAYENLKIGNFDRGWSLFQTRPDGYEKYFEHLPKWKGETIDHLILYEDQGIGDALFSLRYLPMVQARVDHITVFLMNDALAQLITTSFPHISVIIHDQPVPAATARCPMMTLPCIFNTHFDTIPSTFPYLKISADNACLWEERLKSVLRPRIGIVWGGNPNLPTDCNRSLHFDQLAPLFRAAPGHFVSLQKGIQKEQADFTKAHLVDADPWLDNFASTACLMQHLDLIITVDTSVAHLAGGLHIPVWIFLLFDPDWRWMLDREDSPWYPTLRLFRQTKPAHWTDVIDRMALELKKYMDGNREVLTPTLWTSVPAKQNKHALKLVE